MNTIEIIFLCFLILSLIWLVFLIKKGYAFANHNNKEKQKLKQQALDIINDSKDSHVKWAVKQAYLKDEGRDEVEYVGNEQFHLNQIKQYDIVINYLNKY